MALGQLIQLQRLHLPSNRLSGSIPAALGQLGRLQELVLSSNQLSGPIPAELGRLTQLQKLSLSSNQLSGPVPAALGRLSQLRWLYLGHNQLSGAIPAELNRSANLKVLQLEGNQLLPQNKDRAALEDLYHATNGASWKRRTNWLSNASLGTWAGITVNNAGRVIELNLSFNQLSGTLPAALGQLTQLQKLHLSSNQLSGPIPAELGRLSQLRFLYLNDNQLSGTLPMALGQLTQLQRLHLSSNQLSGPIPAELGQLTQLQRLDLASNRLSGAIPAELNRLANLKIVRLEGNQLLPQNKDRAALEALYQATNGASWKRRTNWLSSASLGTWYGITVDNTGRVIKLKLSSNRLSGHIPSALGQLAQLQELDLSLNQLSGSIPAALGQLDRLQGLVLSFNQLSGSIPSELNRLEKKNTPRIDLDLSMFSVFIGLSDPETARVLPELQEACFFPQEQIYAKGDELVYLYCLQEGTVQLEREATESPRTVGPGSLLGLVSLMSQQPCPEHAFASTEVRLITLTRAAVQQLSRDIPRFGENLWRVATAEPAAPPAVTTPPVNPYIQPTPTPPEPTGGSPSSRQNEDFLPAEPVPSPPASGWKELATLSWVGKIRFLFTLLALLYLLAALAVFLLPQILPAEILETLSGFLPG